MAINLRSCCLAMEHVIPLMESAEGESIINSTTIGAIRYRKHPKCLWALTVTPGTLPTPRFILCVTKGTISSSSPARSR